MAGLPFADLSRPVVLNLEIPHEQPVAPDAVLRQPVDRDLSRCFGPRRDDERDGRTAGQIQRRFCSHRRVICRVRRRLGRREIGAENAVEIEREFVGTVAVEVMPFPEDVVGLEPDVVVDDLRSAVARVDDGLRQRGAGEGAPHQLLCRPHLPARGGGVVEQQYVRRSHRRSEAIAAVEPRDAADCVQRVHRHVQRRRQQPGWAQRRTRHRDDGVDGRR